MPSDHSLPEGTHTVVMGMGDLNGIMRGKRFPVGHWETVLDEGAAFSLALLSIDMTSDVWETPHANFSNGYPDLRMRPIEAPVALPWEPGVAFCMGAAEGMTDGSPVPIDPRQALLRQVERAARMGLTIQVGAELEFYLLDPETDAPRDEGIDVYGLARAAELEHVLGPIRRDLEAAGIPIEQSNPEYAAGQAEVNIRYGEALEAADRVVKFRSLVKQLALAHGYRATFMAKPFAGQSGNGFHCHYSAIGEGGNVFAEGARLGPQGRAFVAGLQSRMAEAALCGSATVNGFRRRRPYSFCPVNASWGIDNRTAGIRVIEGSRSAVRAEKRDAGADCNPYLLMAADIASGLDGMESGAEPTPLCEGDAYADASAPPIPTDLPEALRLARGSDWLRGVLGADMHEIYCQQAERELAFFDDQVTEVERARYLRAF